MATYSASQRSGGGFNYTDPYGNPISALGYAKGTNTPFYNVLQNAVVSGDKYASNFLDWAGNNLSFNEPTETVVNKISGPLSGPAAGYNYGFDPYSFTWMNDGGAITGGGGSNFTLDEARKQKQGIYETAGDAATVGARSRYDSILDFINDLKSGQRSLDERGVQNELSKKQGFTSIMDMVGRGIRSGGVMLANRNATSSSAADQLARAYGDIGTREMGNVGNQYELENRGIGLAQTDLEGQRATGLRKFETDKANKIDQLVSDARQQLASLDAAMADANLTERIQIEQEKEQIRNQVSSVLSDYDDELSRGVGEVKPTSAMDRQRTAFDLFNRGRAPTNPFKFSTSTPAQFQNTGPFSGTLPLFLSPRRKTTA